MKNDQKKKVRNTAANLGNLDERAMLVHLSIGFWQGRKRDKDKTNEVAKQSQADDDAGTWWTRVVPLHAVKPIVNARLQARADHLKFTLPWRDDGFRVLPAAMFMKYTAAMRIQQEKYKKVVATFLKDYPGYVKAAPKRLGSLFKAEMLPTPAELEDKYPWSLRFVPLPTAGDFRVELGSSRTEEIRKAIEKDSKAAMEAAMSDLWNRLHESVGKIAERLDDDEGVFRKNLIENVTELCEMLPAMNVTGDPDLEAARQQVIAKLTKQEPEVLRKNKAVRADTAKAANDILKKMEAYRAKK